MFVSANPKMEIQPHTLILGLCPEKLLCQVWANDSQKWKREINFNLGKQRQNEASV